MKKTAFALTAVAAFSLASCDDRGAGNSSANTAGATTNEAVSDVNQATIEEAASLNALNENANDILADEAGANSSVANQAGAASNASTGKQ